MDISRWIARREADWKRLHRLLLKSEQQGIKALSAQEIQQLASLYRSSSGDLARAQTHQVSPTVIADLQALLTRGFHQIYQGSRRQEWRSVLHFYAEGLPQLLRETWLELAISTGLLLGAGYLAWELANGDPGFIATVVPEHVINTVRDKGELWTGSIVGVEPLASSRIMTNNLAVSFAAVGGGISLGLFTIYLLVSNGLALGAIAALVAQHGLAYPFWAFVFPHGALEIPAIAMAGAAGLLIARGLLFPGRYTRAQALKAYGNRAAQLLYGIVPMLVVAGIIEGFISPQPGIPDLIKYLLGLTTFVLVGRYGLRF